MVAAVVVGGQRALAIDGAAELAAPDDERVVRAGRAASGRRSAPPSAGRCRGTGRRSAWAASCAGPSRDGRAARTARRARPAGGPAGSCRRNVPRLLRRPGRSSSSVCSAPRPTGRSAPARWSACGRPARTGRCAWRSPGRRYCCALQPVERGQVVEHRAARVAASTPVGVRQVQHRVAGRAELHALILRRQEAAAPQAVVERLIAGVAACPG